MSFLKNLFNNKKRKESQLKKNNEIVNKGKEDFDEIKIPEKIPEFLIECVDYLEKNGLL